MAKTKFNYFAQFFLLISFVALFNISKLNAAVFTGCAPNTLAQGQSGTIEVYGTGLSTTSGGRNWTVFFDNPGISVLSVELTLDDDLGAYLAVAVQISPDAAVGSVGVSGEKLDTGEIIGPYYIFSISTAPLSVSSISPASGIRGDTVYM